MPPSKTDSISQDQAEITIGILSAIERDSSVTQRSLAQDMGIALGMANAYLKRCVKKGLVKVSQVPANRYAYYLTPKGFSEKSRLTAEFLSQSFNFFRAARMECSNLLALCANRRWTPVALVGPGDLAEVAVLCARDSGMDLTTVIQALDSGQASFQGLDLITGLERVVDFEAVLITDMQTPQETFDKLALLIPPERILTPEFLHISRNGGPA
ncbi:winged helix-turn-helix transcriptional regulator [Magnetospira sp. QH-2]|uniref:winged helix-turn-helix transcriptional regulator n=1 Tax=Magnetospira sp. (strain QH-2) TaxID=1288970 RepID=UPI00069693FC|nr:winged helix-turn-helix transcriptional regulator [Magnetospira sp. QH-2]